MKLATQKNHNKVTETNSKEESTAEESQEESEEPNSTKRINSRGITRRKRRA